MKIYNTSLSISSKNTVYFWYIYRHETEHISKIYFEYLMNLGHFQTEIKKINIKLIIEERKQNLPERFKYL